LPDGFSFRNVRVLADQDLVVAHNIYTSNAAQHLVNLATAAKPELGGQRRDQLGMVGRTVRRRVGVATLTGRTPRRRCLSNAIRVLWHYPW
jgi:hypothetical protein